MKNVALLIIGFLLVGVGTYILVRPGGVMVTVPEYANAEDKFGFVRGFAEENGMTSFLFDEATWVTGEGSADMPNGFKIVNDNTDTVNFFFAPDVVVQVVDMADQDDALREVTLAVLRDDLIKDFDIMRPFIISFDGQGRVEKMQEQYVP